MKRYILNVFIGDNQIFLMEFKTITSVARCIDKFLDQEANHIWFYLFDCIKDRSIDVKELMRIWHS